MDISKLKSVLRIIYPKIKNNPFKWRLDGSANLLLQGINIPIKDLDIVCEEKSIEFFRKNLSEFIVKDFFNEKKKAQSLILNVLDEEVEINYYPFVNIDLFQGIINVKLEKMNILVLNLKQAEIFYRNIGRIKEADLIKEFIK